ncbi:MAG: hypothetical protein MHM6MM_001196 [Cercozoa sp. M6MM]
MLTATGHLFARRRLWRTFSSASQKLVVSDSCAERLRALSQKKEQPVLLRVGVEGGGCSGFQYRIELCGEDDVKDHDLKFEHPEGGAVVVDDLSIEYMLGATVDYVQEMARAKFEITSNPVADHACGCKASFSPKVM